MHTRDARNTRDARERERERERDGTKATPFRCTDSRASDSRAKQNFISTHRRALSFYIRAHDKQQRTRVAHASFISLEQSANHSTCCYIHTRDLERCKKKSSSQLCTDGRQSTASSNPRERGITHFASKSQFTLFLFFSLRAPAEWNRRRFFTQALVRERFETESRPADDFATTRRTRVTRVRARVTVAAPCFVATTRDESRAKTEVQTPRRVATLPRPRDRDINENFRGWHGAHAGTRHGTTSNTNLAARALAADWQVTPGTCAQLHAPYTARPLFPSFPPTGLPLYSRAFDQRHDKYISRYARDFSFSFILSMKFSVFYLRSCSEYMCVKRLIFVFCLERTSTRRDETLTRARA